MNTVEKIKCQTCGETTSVHVVGAAISWNGVCKCGRTEQRAFVEKLLEDWVESCDEAIGAPVVQWQIAARRAEFERLFPTVDNAVG